MFSQPVLKVRELDRARFSQRTRSEPTHPIVMNAKSRCDGSVLPYSGLNRLSCLLNSFFNVHLGVDTIVVLVPL